MKLTFLYAPVTDLAAGIAFYRDVLGWDEAWREGDHTVAFATPDSDVQVMVSVDTDPAGPMYLVDSVDAYLAANPALAADATVQEIPDGKVVRLADPAGNAFYVLDQSTAS